MLKTATPEPSERTQNIVCYFKTIKIKMNEMNKLRAVALYLMTV